MVRTLKFKALIFLILPGIALLVAVGCAPTAKPVTPPPVTVTPAVVKQYVGNEACGECHAAELKSHLKTYHAKTFHPFTVAALGKTAPPAGNLPGTTSAIAVIEGQYVLTQPTTGRMRPLDYALGSGKQGMTFVAVGEDNSVFEMRKSYSLQAHQWYATPGQEKYASPDVTGKRHLGADAQMCIQCHTVTTPTGSLNPEPKFMGVGCESCHGPGSEHIAAVKAGRPVSEAGMEALHSAGGKRINTLCGACHQTPETVEAMAEPQRLSQRFMPYGLAKSTCFQKSGDRLTCITCHAPHDNASTNNKEYEKTCLNCHSHAAPGTTALIPEPHKVCPVNPRAGCIPCHMPKRKVFTGNDIPIMMADHWIRVNKASLTGH